MDFNMGHERKADAHSSGVCSAVLPLLRKSALIIIALMMMVAIFSTPVAADRQMIEKVEISDLNDAVKITVSTSKPLSLHDFRIGAKLIAFDLYGHLARNQQKRVSIGSGGITGVRCGWYKSSPPVVRVVVTTTDSREYSIDQENGGRHTVITVFKPNAAPKPVVKKVADVVVEPKPIKADSAVSGPVSTVSAPMVAVEPVKVNAVTPIKDITAKAIQVEPEMVLPEPMTLVASAVPMALSTPNTTQRTSRTAAQPRISLDFVASDIHDVLKALALQSNVNIVASPDVKGNVTVSLNQVSVDEALRLVANLSGYRFAFMDGTYVVGTPENLNSLIAGSMTADETERITELVAIRHANPAIINRLLENEFSSVDFSTPGTDKDSTANGSFTLLLSGHPRAVGSAVSAVNIIENSFAGTAQAEVMELYEVKYADITELPDILTAVIPGLNVGIGPNQGFHLKCPSAVAIDMDSSYSQSTAGPENQAQPTMLIMLGTEAQIDKALDFLARVDVPQHQIIIEARIMDVSDTAARDLGIEWGGDFGTLTSISFTEDRTPEDPALSISRFIRSPIGLDARLKAIVASGKGNIVASPNVLALDGKPASIFIGDEIKYVTRLDKTEQGTSVTTETARVGVQLHTISRINSDGYITMDLHPEVSVIRAWRQLPEVSLALPEISRRFVNGTVRVRDGETIVIGGLIKDEELRSMSGIPLLKDLPIIGGLFRYERTQKSRSEIMMFITPRIVSSTDVALTD